MTQRQMDTVVDLQNSGRITPSQREAVRALLLEWWRMLEDKQGGNEKVKP